MIKNLLWMPIDIPKFPIINFYLEPKATFFKWRFAKITDSCTGKYQASAINNTIIDDYPEFIQWLNYFPFDEIINIKFNVQQAQINAHIDFVSPDEEPNLYKNNQLNDPCGYRVLIKGRRTNCLYVETSSGRKYTSMPETTDVYVLGQTNCLHGVDLDDHRQIMYLHFNINQMRHEELILRSYSKYKEYAIFNN